MNPSVEYKVKIMQAYMEGAQIEACPIYQDQLDIWKEEREPVWNWEHRYYRVMLGEFAKRDTSLSYKIRVMRGFLDGNLLEGAFLPQPWKPENYALVFHPCQSPNWDWNNVYYRLVKP